MQIAFLMAAHQRLGAEACGQWQRHMAEQHCADDVLRLILEKLMVKRGVIRNEQNNIVVKSTSTVIGQGQLKDPRAIALSAAPGKHLDSPGVLLKLWPASTYMFILKHVT